jgi:hypothetical protein
MGWWLYVVSLSLVNLIGKYSFGIDRESSGGFSHLSAGLRPIVTRFSSVSPQGFMCRVIGETKGVYIIFIIWKTNSKYDITLD